MSTVSNQDPYEEPRGEKECFPRKPHTGREEQGTSPQRPAQRWAEDKVGDRGSSLGKLGAGVVLAPWPPVTGLM